MVKYTHLIPYIFRLQFCCVENLYEKDNFIPVMIIMVKDGECSAIIDRKCPCECDNRIEYLKFECKQECEEWIKNNTSVNREDNCRWYIVN